MCDDLIQDIRLAMNYHNLVKIMIHGTSKSKTYAYNNIGYYPSTKFTLQSILFIMVNSKCISNLFNVFNNNILNMVLKTDESQNNVIQSCRHHRHH